MFQIILLSLIFITLIIQLVVSIAHKENVQRAIEEDSDQEIQSPGIEPRAGGHGSTRTKP